MTVVWANRALRHLVSLRECIGQDNPKVAAETGDAILAAVERLSAVPNMGKPGRVAGTREFVVPGTKYLIVYRVRDDRLEIIAVLHGRRKWPTRF